MSYLTLRSPDNDLIPLLRSASSDDLGILVEFILNASTSQLEIVPEFKLNNPRYSEKIYNGDHRLYCDEISAEIQKFGGNTLANMLRGGQGVPYAEIVRDVADHMGVNYNKSSSVEIIEGQIQLKVLENAYEKMSDSERREFLKEVGIDTVSGIPSALPVMLLQSAIKIGGFASYKIAVIVANAIARALLGRGLSFAAGATLTRTMSVLAGPIGWAITALWTVIDLAGPAYRVTVPAVLHIAYIRQKSIIEICRNCNEVIPNSSTFCPSCGTKLK